MIFLKIFLYINFGKQRDWKAIWFLALCYFKNKYLKKESNSWSKRLIHFWYCINIVLVTVNYIFKKLDYDLISLWLIRNKIHIELHVHFANYFIYLDIWKSHLNFRRNNTNKVLLIKSLIFIIYINVYLCLLSKTEIIFGMIKWGQ